MKIKLKIKDFNYDLQAYIHPIKKDIGVSSFLERNNNWEPYETSFFVNAILNKNYFLDIGANIGYYSLIASKLISKNGSIQAFEPEKNNLKLLYKNIALNNLNNIEVFEKACSYKLSKSQLLLSSNNLGDHRLSDVSSNYNDISIIDTVTVDSIVSKNNNFPDVVKIDTQGAELKILKGMKKLLINSNKKTIFFLEFWPYGIFKQGDGVKELIDIINLDSFNIFAVFEQNKSCFRISHSDLIRWAKTIMQVGSRSDTNLILAHKDNQFSVDINNKNKKNNFEFNKLYTTVKKDIVSKYFVPVGWSFPESDGVWSDGLFAEIFINDLNFKRGKFYNLFFRLMTLTPSIYLSIYINDIFLQNLLLNENKEFCDYQINLPHSFLSTRKNSFVVSLQFSSGFKPQDILANDDKRLLSAKFQNFAILERNLP